MTRPVSAQSDRMPVPGVADFPRNAWYVAAFSSEVSDAKPLARVLCGMPVVLYRDDTGGPVALYDQCPHRGLPLSEGRLEGDGLIRCGYHGFAFGSDGRCRELTTTDRIPAALRARAFPLVEIGGWIWMWPGDPELADPALLPDHRAIRMEAEGWRRTPAFPSEWPGNYLLQIENSSDNLHLDHLHGSLNVDDGLLGRIAPQVEVHGRMVRGVTLIERTPSTMFEEWFGFDIDKGALRDREVVTEMYCPSLSRIEWSVTECDRPDARRQTYAINIAITPQTDRTHWVFNASALDFEGRPQTDEDLNFLIYQVFEQDKACFASIQDRVDRFGTAQTDVSVGYDERVLRVRRILGQMLAEEQGLRSASKLTPVPEPAQ